MLSLPSLVYFYLASPFAVLAVFLSDRNDGYLAFALGARPLLVMAAVRLLRDPDDPWHRLMRAMPGVLHFGVGVVSVGDLLGQSP